MSGVSMSLGRSSSRIYIGTTSNETELYCNRTLIAGAYGQWPGYQMCTITSKGAVATDAVAIQSANDYNWLIAFYNDASVVKGQIGGTGSNSIVYNTNSDRRLKKNIQPMDSMIEKIMRMNPCSFEWITDNEIGYGFIAQEVYTIFPQLRSKHPSCEGSCDDCPLDCSGNPVYYGLDYGTFTPYIIKAMQEMKISYDAKIQQQSEQITQLLERVTALESLMRN